MGVRTRSATSSPTKPVSTAPTSTLKRASLDQQEPPRLLVIPQDLSVDARILSLKHPRDNVSARFLFCPMKGLFEFTRIAAPPLDYRSILFSRSDKTADSKPEPLNLAEPYMSAGYINRNAEFYIATPFDLSFILLALLPNSMASGSKTLFQPLDDLLEPCFEENPHLKYIVTHGKSMVENEAQKICDTIDAGDETMIRMSEDKITNLIWPKAEAVVRNGLPPSMEEKFVTRALEVPIVSVKREESTVFTSTPLTTTDAEEDDDKNGSVDSQSTVASSTSSAVFSEVSVASSTTTTAPDTPSSDLRRLQCLRVAMNFILASYVPQSIASHVRTKLLRNERIDFTPLDSHLKRIADLKAEALAARSFADFGLKRGIADDDEAAEERAEKRRKQEEEDKRKKAAEPRGLRELKKVNVSGMKKMSDFFTKKPAAKSKT